MRETLTLVAFNRGDHAKLHDILNVLEGGRTLVHAAALAEMYDQPDILNGLEKRGYGVIRTGRKTANPLVYHPKCLRLHKELISPLLPAARRAGKHNMAKQVVGGRFMFLPAHQRVVLGSTHNLQTQYLPGRRVASQQFNDELSRSYGRFRCPTFVGADWNATPDGHSMHPLWRNDWKYTQRVGEALPTFGRRAIDGWIWQNGPDVDVKLDRQWTSGLGRSDHRPPEPALYASFEIPSARKRLGDWEERTGLR